MAKPPIQLLPLENEQLGVKLAFITHELMQNLEQSLTVPHRHDHYICFLLEGGHLEFSVDCQLLTINQPALLFSFPGQVHQLVSAQDVSGWVIAFKARLVDEHARNAVERSLARVAMVSLTEPETAWFSGLFKLLETSLYQPFQDRFQQGGLQGLLNAFFYRGVALFQTQEAARAQAYSSRSVEITETFQQLVKAHFQTQKKPSDYAARLSLTTSYLNDTVKAVTGFSATQLIQQVVFGEAQRLLVYSGSSVKEIAFQLGYEDDKYFIRLFGKATGSSPARFRERYRT